MERANLWQAMYASFELFKTLFRIVSAPKVMIGSVCMVSWRRRERNE